MFWSKKRKVFLKPPHQQQCSSSLQFYLYHLHSSAVTQLCRYNHNYPAQPAQQCSETVVPVQQYNYLAQPAQAAGVNSDQWCSATSHQPQEAQGTQHSRILWCKSYFYYFFTLSPYTIPYTCTNILCKHYSYLSVLPTISYTLMYLYCKLILYLYFMLNWYLIVASNVSNVISQLTIKQY